MTEPIGIWLCTLHFSCKAKHNTRFTPPRRWRHPCYAMYVGGELKADLMGSNCIRMEVKCVTSEATGCTVCRGRETFVKSADFLLVRDDNRLQWTINKSIRGCTVVCTRSAQRGNVDLVLAEGHITRHNCKVKAKRCCRNVSFVKLGRLHEVIGWHVFSS